MSENNPLTGQECDQEEWELVNESISSEDGSVSSSEYVKLDDDSVSYTPQTSLHHASDTEPEPATVQSQVLPVSGEINVAPSSCDGPVSPSFDGTVAPPVNDGPVSPSCDGSVVPSCDGPEEKPAGIEEEVREVREEGGASRLDEWVEDDYPSPAYDLDVVYADLKERLSARMSRESSSESEGSDIVRLERVSGPGMHRADDVMLISGSSISSRFSFIQHADGDEEESLPESDISLLTEGPREEALPPLRPTSHPHYRHNPNPDLNFWLNVTVVLVLALAVGLGIGHAVGSGREVNKQRDIHQGNEDRINSLQQNLIQCTYQLSNQQPLTQGGSEADFRKRIGDLESRNLALGDRLHETMRLLDAALSEKKRLSSLVETLRSITDSNTENLARVSDESSSRDDQLSSELGETRVRIDRLESRSHDLEVRSSDFSQLRAEIELLQKEKEGLRRRVEEMMAGGGTETRLKEMMRQNEELGRKYHRLTEEDKHIREEIEGIRAELEKERSLSHLWAGLLAAKDASLAAAYRQFRAAVNASSSLSDAAAAAAGPSLNASKDLLEFLSSNIEKMKNRTKEDLPEYVEKTKKTVANFAQKIQDTWAMFSKTDFKKNAKKFQEDVRKLGKKMADNVQTFSKKIKNKFTEKFQKKRVPDDKNKKQESNEEKQSFKHRKNSENFYKHQEKEDKDSYKDRKNSENRRRKMERKFAKLKKKIDRLTNESWSELDRDDFEEMFEDLRDYVYLAGEGAFQDLSPWFLCQREWFEDQYSPTTAYRQRRYSGQRNVDCAQHLFSWQTNYEDELKSEKNSTADEEYVKKDEDSSWYFKSEENENQESQSEWYFKRAESRDDSHHPPEWYFKRAESGDDSHHPPEWYFKRADSREESHHPPEWYFKRAESREESHHAPEWYFKRAESREESHHPPEWYFKRSKQRVEDRRTKRLHNFHQYHGKIPADDLN